MAILIANSQGDRLGVIAVALFLLVIIGIVIALVKAQTARRNSAIGAHRRISTVARKLLRFATPSWIEDEHQAAALIQRLVGIAARVRDSFTQVETATPVRDNDDVDWRFVHRNYVVWPGL
ncbi:MAG TPA: hypothetical protein VHN14_09750 [Kofleriaceae bacterium]|jgi:hypothetical protein|nr:hypothetical protein [Kofleriaceae bacterium]